jgi:hypothetical protein
MGAPNLAYDPEEDQRLSAQKRAEQKWGMKDNTGSPAEAESNADENNGSDSATNNAEKGLLKKSMAEAREKSGVNAKSQKKKDNKKKYLAGGIFASLVLSVVGAAFLLPSILMNTITTKLTDAFLDRAKFAVEQRAETYMTRYVTEVIGGSLRNCGQVVSKDCTPSKNGSQFSKLATSWRQNRIETRLLDKHGLTFKLDETNPNRVEVFKIDALGKETSIGEYGKRSVVREVTGAMKETTRFDGVLSRRHIKSVLVKKYGAKRFCFLACNKRDNFDQAKIKGVNKIKLRMIARVAEVSSARTTSYLLCLTAGCSPAEIERSDKDAIQSVLKKTDAKIMKNLEADMIKYKTKNLGELITRRVVDKIVTKVAGPTAAKTIVSTLPLVGQIYLAATLAEFVTVLDEKIENREISLFLKDVNEQEAALYATQALTIAEDAQSQEGSVEDNWAAFQLFSQFSSSRLSQNISGSNLGSVKCADGTVLSGHNDPLVCDDLQVQPSLLIEELRNEPVVDTFLELTSTYDACIGAPLITSCPTFTKPIRGPVKGALYLVNGLTGFAAETAMNVVTKIPLIDKITNFVGKQALVLFSWVSGKVFKTIVVADAGGQVAFDQLGAGFDVLGNAFSRGDGDLEAPGSSNIGGVLLTPTEQASLDVAIAEDRRLERQNMSVFARLFDIDNANSLASTTLLDTALALPLDGGPITAPSVDPTQYIQTIASAVGITKKTNAAGLSTRDRTELYGVSQYGIPLGDRAYDDTLLDLTEDEYALQCATYKNEREDSKYTDQNTGRIEYTLTDPCALDKVARDSLIKIFDLDENSAVAQGGNAVNTDQLNCGGYVTADNGGVLSPASYSPSITLECLQLQQQCQSVAAGDTIKILCEAFKYDGVLYGNNYGSLSGTKANGIYGFTAPTGNDFGIDSQRWIANRTEGLSPNNLLECSGLTTVALFDAFGYEGYIGCSGDHTQRSHPDLFRETPLGEVRAGDFLTKTFGCNSNTGGHIAIAAGPAKSDGTILVYETNEWGKSARFNVRQLSYFSDGGKSRYIGPGI